MTPEITQLLELAQDPSNQAARDDLYRRIEADLRRIAHARRVEQPHVHCASTTELIHEVWVRLLGKTGPETEPRWQSRRHFFATASLVIQNLLVDHYRKVINGPRVLESGLLESLPDRGGLDPAQEVERAERFLVLHQALQALEADDPNAAVIVRLRCFGKVLPLPFAPEQIADARDLNSQGMKLQEMAEYLNIPLSTVHSRWKRALLFLNRHLPSDVHEGFAEEVDS
jgi:RNA polymerase sigma factor (sigma-70 family)